MQAIKAVLPLQPKLLQAQPIKKSYDKIATKNHVNKCHVETAFEYIINFGNVIFVISSFGCKWNDWKIFLCMRG